MFIHFVSVFPHFGFSRHFNLHSWIYFQVQSSKSGCHHPAAPPRGAHFTLKFKSKSAGAPTTASYRCAVSALCGATRGADVLVFLQQLLRCFVCLFVGVALPFSEDDQFARWKLTFALANFPAFAMLSTARCPQSTYTSPHSQKHMTENDVLLADVRFFTERFFFYLKSFSFL